MIQVCRDTSDAAALYLPQRLYLKPFAKLNISVQLPPSKVHGKSLSNWELTEKIRKMAQPESFSALKVTKHSTEVIRFEAEMESQGKVEHVIMRINDRVVQLTNYPDPLKLKVTEAKSDFPSRHAWDSFFRDATDMDEMKPGERPDTIHISNLPIRWFVHERDKDEDALPSESIFKKVFEKFGTVRQVDVPVADPFRMQMKSAMRGITTPPQDAALYFEGYIQFGEYVGFVRCMDALRGKKLLRKRECVADWCSIKVDFDKTKHMTDAAVKRRGIVRERLTSRQRAKDDVEKEAKDKVYKSEARERQKYERAEQDKLQKMKEREERRKKKNLAKLMERDDVDLNGKVAEEQKKLIKAQKKLQAVRLIEELFKRIELRPELQTNGEHRGRYYEMGERSARSRIVERIKRQHQAVVDDQRNQLKCALDGRIVIRSALETKKVKRDSSADSISSDENRRRDYKRVKSERLTTPEREMEYNKAAAGMYGLPGPYQFGYPFGMPQPAYPFPPQNPMYYPVRGAYYPPPEAFAARRGMRGRGRGRGRPRMPYFDGPDASHQYYKYFKKLSETESRNEHDERRSRTRSRSRSRRRSYSRSRSRRRSYSRSRSRRRSRSRSRSRRSRSRSRRSRSRSRRSRSHHSRSRSRSRRRSKSHRRSKSKTPQRNISTPKQNGAAGTPPKTIEKARSKSWDLPKDGERIKSWSKSPINQ